MWISDEVEQVSLNGVVGTVAELWMKRHVDEPSTGRRWRGRWLFRAGRLREMDTARLSGRFDRDLDERDVRRCLECGRRLLDGVEGLPDDVVGRPGCEVDPRPGVPLGKLGCK